MNPSFAWALVAPPAASGTPARSKWQLKGLARGGPATLGNRQERCWSVRGSARPEPQTAAHTRLLAPSVPSSHAAFESTSRPPGVRSCVGGSVRPACAAAGRRAAGSRADSQRSRGRSVVTQGSPGAARPGQLAGQRGRSRGPLLLW